MPSSTAISPTPNVALPHQSIRAARRTPVSRSLRYAQTVPNTPTGTDTRNTRCQFTGASTPPTIRPRNEPPMPATWFTPSARPRRSGGNASVRIAVELANSSAPPTPCSTRIAISQSAPASPCIHVAASRIENTVNTAKPRLYIRVRPNMSPRRPKLTTSTAVTTR